MSTDNSFDDCTRGDYISKINHWRGIAFSFLGGIVGIFLTVAFTAFLDTSETKKDVKSLINNQKNVDIAVRDGVTQVNKEFSQKFSQTDKILIALYDGQNELIKNYDLLLDSHNELIDSHNELIAQFNKLLKRVTNLELQSAEIQGGYRIDSLYKPMNQGTAPMSALVSCVFSLGCAFPPIDDWSSKLLKVQHSSVDKLKRLDRLELDWLELDRLELDRREPGPYLRKPPNVLIYIK